MREVVVVEGVRTAIGKKNGGLKDWRSDNLLAMVLKELVNRSNIPKEVIEDVIIGCVTQTSEQGGNIARIAALLAEYPISVPGVTIDRQCGSSLQAIHFGAQVIAANDAEIVVAGGVESMTRVPMFSNVSSGGWNEIYEKRFGPIHQGLGAERINEVYNISRNELDEYAFNSHKKAIVAIEKGYFQKELFSDLEGNLIVEDEGPRRDTTLEKLSILKTVFKEDGMITAGNASMISDGAAAVLLMSKEKAIDLGMKPRFSIIAKVAVGSDPHLMLTGPIEATKKALQKAGLTIDDIDRIEVNEAFATVPIAWMREFPNQEEKLNVNGGAISLGHPLGATGARLFVSLMNELERIGATYGLIAICEGHGMANATIIKRIK